MNPLFYLILTIIIEYIIYVIIIRKNFRLLFIYCTLINLVTWPLANIFYDVSGLFWIIEICVFAIEAVLIKYLINISWKRAIIISFIANLITAGIGFIVPIYF